MKETYGQIVISGDSVAGLRALFGVTNQDYFTRDPPYSKYIRGMLQATPISFFQF